jgi:hypothetical protein
MLPAEACSNGTCLPGENSLQTLDFNKMANAMYVKSGAVLLLRNIQVFNLAPQQAYSYSSRQPYRSTGQGTTTWPSIALAPNATVSGPWQLLRVTRDSSKHLALFTALPCRGKLRASPGRHRLVQGNVHRNSTQGFQGYQ